MFEKLQVIANNISNLLYEIYKVTNIHNLQNAYKIGLKTFNIFKYISRKVIF
jgi:hypothetical protein